MPFKSQAQRGFMYANHPDIAKRFEAETPKGSKLPYHVAKKARGEALAQRIKSGVKHESN